MNSNTPFETNTKQTEIETAEVTGSLNAILSTDKFAASPQMSAFLKYVVEQTLLGNTRRIKAFTVGLEALGKPASFDPQTDPSVRVLAKRLRHSLEAYYEQHRETSIIIDMKPGSYVPKFMLRGQSAEELPTVVNGSNTLTQTLASNTQSTGLPMSNATSTFVRVNPIINTQESKEAANPASVNKPDAVRQDSGIQRLWNAYKSAPKVA